MQSQPHDPETSRTLAIRQAPLSALRTQLHSLLTMAQEVGAVITTCNSQMWTWTANRGKWCAQGHSEAQGTALLKPGGLGSRHLSLHPGAEHRPGFPARDGMQGLGPTGPPYPCEDMAT